MKGTPLHRIGNTKPCQVRHRLSTEIVLRDIHRGISAVQGQQVWSLVRVLWPFDRSVAVWVQRRGEPDEVVLQIASPGGAEDVLEVRTVRLHVKTSINR